MVAVLRQGAPGTGVLLACVAGLAAWITLMGAALPALAQPKAAAAAVTAGAEVTPAKPAAPGQKVLRYAFNAGETGFDPARINDLYSRIVTAHIFEALYAYDHLARV